MNLVLDSKLVLLQTHYWLVHSPPPTPFALAIFFEISYHISPFFFFLKNNE